MELGCGMDEYMELKPVLKGSLETGPGVGVGPGVPGDPSMLPPLPPLPPPVLPPVLGSTLLLPGLFWFLSFSSRLHFALLLENQTCKHWG